jgi:hypothetical protein
MPPDIKQFKKYKKDTIRMLQIVQKLNSTTNQEEISNPLFILRCHSYYFEKKKDEKSNEFGFTLNYVYQLVKRDLF